MGERPDDIVDLAFALRDLRVDSLPLNFLHPIDGTPLAGVNVPIHNVSFVGADQMLELLREEEKKSGAKLLANLVTTQVVPSYEDKSLPAVKEYRAATGVHAGWGWVAMLRKGDVLNFLGGLSEATIVLDQAAIPVRPQVRSVCELLGLDPLYVANEAKLIAVVEASAAEPILAAMHAHPLGSAAQIIGRVTREHPGTVVMRTVLGTTRIVDMLAGDQLPRIC